MMVIKLNYLFWWTEIGWVWKTIEKNCDFCLGRTKIYLLWEKRVIARILKAHSHSYSMSVSSIWASLEGQRCFWIAGGVVSYLTMWLLTLQLFKNNTDTQEKLRLNLPPLIECEWAFRIQAYVNPWSVNTLSLTRKIVCPQTVNLKSRAHLVALPLGEHIVHGQIVW
jgi:hypothetical protein